MSIITLYHGTPNEFVTPQYGYGEDKHDYGKGFYLTENIELAKEWAVCRPTETNGWVHKYELDISDLKILDFQKYDVLSWLAELMKHRDAADTKRYKVLSKIHREVRNRYKHIRCYKRVGELTLHTLYCQRICARQCRYGHTRRIAIIRWARHPILYQIRTCLFQTHGE